MRRDDKEATRRQSRGLVANLAESTQTPIDRATEVFEAQLRLLEHTSKVTAFVEVFAARRAREILTRKD
jgi:hypothetical protein